MTIFDALLYPISDKPTVLELYHIPDEIFDIFRKKINVDAGYTRMFVLQQGIVPRNIELLRRVIMEYDT